MTRRGLDLEKNPPTGENREVDVGPEKISSGRRKGGNGGKIFNDVVQKVFPGEEVELGVGWRKVFVQQKSNVECRRRGEQVRRRFPSIQRDNEI